MKTHLLAVKVGKAMGWPCRGLRAAAGSPLRRCHPGITTLLCTGSCRRRIPGPAPTDPAQETLRPHRKQASAHQRMRQSLHAGRLADQVAAVYAKRSGFMTHMLMSAEETPAIIERTDPDQIIR